MKSLKITLALVAACAAFAVVPAHAAVTLDGGIFELDGNIIVTDTVTPKVDWARLFIVSGTSVPTVNSSQPAGFVSLPVFVRDFTPGGTDDASTYTTGSKDILSIGGGGGSARRATTSATRPTC